MEMEIVVSFQMLLPGFDVIRPTIILKLIHFLGITASMDGAYKRLLGLLILFVLRQRGLCLADGDELFMLSMRSAGFFRSAMENLPSVSVLFNLI